MATAIVTPPPSGNDVTSIVPKKGHVRARCSIRRSEARHRRFLPETESALMMKKPVMFVVEVGAVITTILMVRDFRDGSQHPRASRSRYALAVVHGPVRELSPRHAEGRASASGYVAQDKPRPPRAARKMDPLKPCRLRNCGSGDIVRV